MKKRVVAALMAALMCIGLAAGCGNQEEPSTGGDDANEEENPGNEETPDDTDGDTEEPVTVRWLVPAVVEEGEDHDLVMEDLNKKLVERINVELVLDMIPSAEYADKVKLASTSNEEFDLMFTSSWLNPFVDNVASEALLPLDDLVAEYGQEMMASMPDWLPTAGTVDGVLYAIPNQQIIAEQRGVAVQKEYADKYGLDITSMEDISELYPFLDEIAANEPTLFPIDPRQPLVISQNYEAIVSNAVYIRRGDANMELVSYADIVAEQDKMDKEWYDKGYVREDIVTVTDNSADVKANRYASSIQTYKPGLEAELTMNWGKEYIAIPLEGSYVAAGGGNSTMTAVNVNSKNPEAAIQLLNLIYTDKEIFNELLFGIEGTHYTKTGDNSVEPVENSKYNYGGAAWVFGNQFLAYTLPGQAEDVWEQTAQLNEEAEVSPLRGFTFDPANVQAEIAQISAVVAEYNNMQYVAEDIEAFSAEKAERLEQAGIDTVMQEVQTQLDAWKAAQ